jgi:hypothetical protein
VVSSKQRLLEEVPSHMVIGALIALARWGAPRWGVGRTVRLATELASKVPPGRRTLRTRETGLTDRLELARIAAFRASRFIPGANCLHRAFAVRVWLATQGVEAAIVLGFRKREDLEGHAWLEIPTATGRVLRLFCTDEDGYTKVVDEARMAIDLESMRFP